MAKRNGAKIHLDRFAGGRTTPDEVWRRLAIGRACEGCGGPAVIRIRVLADLKELTQRSPEYVAAIMVSSPSGTAVPTIPTKYGPMVKISDIGACQHCQKDAEIAASKHPSWMIVEIQRGPGADKPLVQVPG